MAEKKQLPLLPLELMVVSWGDSLSRKNEIHTNCRLGWERRGKVVPCRKGRRVCYLVSVFVAFDVLCAPRIADWLAGCRGGCASAPPFGMMGMLFWLSGAVRVGRTRSLPLWGKAFALYAWQ